MIWDCPLPSTGGDRIQLAHGSGGRQMNQLIETIFRSAFEDSPTVAADAAVLTLPSDRIAVSTDSFVIQPLFFPGGDIGSLAVHGTVNDLLMRGATPHSLTASFILEEGFPIATLTSLVQSMASAAQADGVHICAGDTKVVERGKADGVYITTTGIGSLLPDRQIGPQQIQVGDAIVINGDLGRHGVAVLACREGLTLELPLLSDAASLRSPVLGLLDAGVDLHCLRDLTRGGLASALNELAAVGVGMDIEAAAIPVDPVVAGVCEILGLDPLQVANEGRFVAFLPADQVAIALETLRQIWPDQEPRWIGCVQSTTPGLVRLRQPFGGDRLLEMLSGEQLPRIC
ncbi:hydrogenase expression/formation protein HypE [Synechococcus elongatus]|uniref:Hydrogenase expression/formation protein HypE n=1 Tax=Synechococcus elongatus PCC 11801 TaxID=2219813 RepID=A0AAN1QQG6_SYNEL|nr:hydrogenase expression/formation protein HypE [Synechococcus elongatus]AZB73711.1 hydrogenase expression/formation protein HypE [Synechococcus elongatus PCC 11801]